MGVLITIAIIVVVLIMLAKLGMSTEIQKSNSIRDIVMAINYGKIHPYNTGMSLNTVKYTVNRLYSDKSEFIQTLDMYELIGVLPSIDLPQIPNAYIERISLGFNRNKVLHSITIYIKDFNKNAGELIKELNAKFGIPTSTSGEFIIWRKYDTVINVCSNGSVSVINESLFGY